MRGRDERATPRECGRESEVVGKGARTERASRSCWLTPRMTSQLEKTAASWSLLSARDARSGCRHFSQKSERSATLRRDAPRW